MSEPIYIGIDPGVKGAVAVIQGDTITLHDVPAYAGGKGQKMNDGLMAELLLPYRDVPVVFCVLEEIFSKPLESNKSALTIGRHWGVWKGLLAGYSIPHEVAPGSVWKRGFRLLSGEKEMSRARAMELFPSYRAALAKKRVDFSEALLLAEYARRRQLGLNG